MADKNKVKVYYSLRDMKTGALQFTGRNSTDLKALRAELLQYAKMSNAKLTPEQEVKIMDMKVGKLAKHVGWKLIKHTEQKEK